MAEAVGAGAATSPPRELPAHAPALGDQPVHAGEAPATRREAGGQPLAEPPPLIEPIGFDEQPAAPAAPRPLATAAQRPERRSFLAPVANPNRSRPADPRAYGERPPLPDVRTRPVARSQLAAASIIEHEPAMPPPTAAAQQAAAPPTAAAAAEPPAASVQAAPAPRKRRRAVTVLEIVALVVLLAVAAAAVHPQWLDPLRQRIPLLAGLGAPSGPLRPPADPSQRFAYFMQRARGGDPEAELGVAVQYAKGDGISRDYAAAAKWFRAAADAGITRAQYDLGVLYEHGRGVPLDYKQAVSWYRRAADGNHPLAQYNLAVAYTKGEGIERNFFDAAMWYDRAALQGVVAAMVNLAILYERGEGVEASNANAYAWYRAAARRGSQPAAQRADELLQAFSPWDQTQAEAKTREVALSIQDSVGEATRGSAAAPPRAASSTSPPTNLRSGFTSTGTGAATESGDGADVNP